MQVFPQFLETCSEHLAGTGADLADFQAFEQECLDMDGVREALCVLPLPSSTPPGVEPLAVGTSLFGLPIDTVML